MENKDIILKVRDYILLIQFLKHKYLSENIKKEIEKIITVFLCNKKKPTYDDNNDKKGSLADLIDL